MADDSKPQAGFLGGKKAPAPQVKEAEPEPAPAPAPAPVNSNPSAGVGFLKKRDGAPGAAAAPQPAQAPAPAAAAQNGAAPAATRPAPRPATAAPAAQAAPAQAPAPAQQVVVEIPPPQVGDRATAEVHLHKGLDHYDRQETDLALGEYQACVQADPSFALGHNNLGMVLIDLERYDEAIASLYESIHCDPQYAEAYNNLGFVLRRMQRQIEAACAYRRFLEIEPDVEEGPRIGGWIETVLKDNHLTELPPFTLPQQAAAAAAQEAPAEPEPAPKAKIKKMAAWEMAAGNMETAAPVSALGEIGGEVLTTATSLPSPRPNPATLQPPPVAAPKAAPAPIVAPVAAPAAAPAAAAPAARPAPTPRAAPPQQATGIIEKGMDAFGQGDLDRAAEEFKRAIELEPENAEAHTNLGKVLVRQEQYDAGIAELQTALQYDPDDPAAYYVLGFGLRALERNVEASEAYEMFLKLMPDARDCAKMRDWVKHIKGAAAFVPAEDTFVDDEQIVTDMDKKFKAALTKFQEGDADTALRECVRILNEDPTHFRTRVLLGRVYLRQKAHDNAIEQLEGALITRPDYTEALYFLGQAHEKRGALDLATKSYKRYIEVAPQAPRAERLAEWLASHSTGETGTASQVQCELCLRFFPGDQVTPHEGKATCRNCLVVMGAAPTIVTPLRQSKTSVTSTAVEVKDIAPVGKKSMVPMIAGILVFLLAAGGGFAYMSHRLDPWLIKFGLLKAPPVKKVPTDVDPLNTFVRPTLDTSKIKIANEPRLAVFPYANWTFTPKLEGLEEADEKAKGWTRETILQNHPPGMELKGDSIVWRPTPTDYAALKKGESYSVTVAVKGSSKAPDGQPFELFSVAKSFTLTSQFGYETAPEFDLGLDGREPVAFAAGDLNGDNHPDLITASGQFRHGGLRLFINRGENQFGAPTQLSSGARFSAAWIGDLFADKSREVVAANWQTGQLKTWFVDNNQPVAGPSIPIGAGPVAIAASDLDGSKKLQIAVLLSVGHALAVTTLTPDRKFGEVHTIPLPGGGGSGFVAPWTSQDAGPGFVVVMPLSDNPIHFVAYNKGAWSKPVSSVVSNSDAPMVVAAAALSCGPDKPGRLAVATASTRTSQIVMMQEKNGKFDVVGTPMTFTAPALNAIACDLGTEGKDDLLVVTSDEARIYFCDAEAGFFDGPVYKVGAMRGPAVVLASKTASRPDVLLLNEENKAVILRALTPDSAPVAPSPTHTSNDKTPDDKAPKTKAN